MKNVTCNIITTHENASNEKSLAHAIVVVFNGAQNHTFQERSKLRSRISKEGPGVYNGATSPSLSVWVCAVTPCCSRCLKQ